MKQGMTEPSEFLLACKDESEFDLWRSSLSKFLNVPIVELPQASVVDSPVVSGNPLFASPTSPDPPPSLRPQSAPRRGSIKVSEHIRDGVVSLAVGSADVTDRSFQSRVCSVHMQSGTIIAYAEKSG